MDEDKDGLFDCQDPDCFDSKVCQGVWCQTALPVNAGVPIGQADSGLALSYEGKTGGIYDNYHAGCNDGALCFAPEAVWKFELSSPMLVSVAHEFKDFFKQPILYVRGADCCPTSELGCAQNNPAVLTSMLLQPGVYFLFVDGHIRFYTDPPVGDVSWRIGRD